MSEETSLLKKTYFGAVALLTAVVSVLFMGASYGIVYLNISQNLFNKLNNSTALVFCISTPLTYTLGVIGYMLKNDSKTLSLIAIALVTIPFAVLFIQFLSSFLK